jgi:hypothetical protein
MKLDVFLAFILYTVSSITNNVLSGETNGTTKRQWIEGW